MPETLSAMTRSMPEITDITAMSVVVARMMPRMVMKLLSLLERRDWTAPFTASQNDALCVVIQTLDGSMGELLAKCVGYHSIVAGSVCTCGAGCQPTRRLW